MSNATLSACVVLPIVLTAVSIMVVLWRAES